VPDAPNDLAAGARGTILYYNPTSWTAQTSGTTNDLFFVRALSATNVYALGAAGTALQYDGAKWTPLQTGGITVALRAADVVITETGAITDVFVVGDGGAIFHSSDGVRWSQQASGTGNNLFGVAAVSASDVFAVGALGTILHYDGRAWSKQR